MTRHRRVSSSRHRRHGVTQAGSAGLTVTPTPSRPEDRADSHSPAAADSESAPKFHCYRRSTVAAVTVTLTARTLPAAVTRTVTVSVAVRITVPGYANEFESAGS